MDTDTTITRLQDELIDWSGTCRRRNCFENKYPLTVNNGFLSLNRFIQSLILCYRLLFFSLLFIYTHASDKDFCI